MIVKATGVYGDTEEEFFQKLLDKNITLFIDVRLRRGMRGSKYSFVNSTYLQKKLNQIGIKYIHIKDLAPTKEIRDTQKEHDIRSGKTKHKRESLGDTFIKLYKENILKKFDFEKFINEFRFETIVFFCVEEKCSACHRCLIIENIKQNYGIDGYCF
jgi:uncharacterized protein (DUF488 family)